LSKDKKVESIGCFISKINGWKKLGFQVVVFLKVGSEAALKVAKKNIQLI
jgi:hypothetical protein